MCQHRLDGAGKVALESGGREDAGLRRRRRTHHPSRHPAQIVVFEADRAAHFVALGTAFELPELLPVRAGGREAERVAVDRAFDLEFVQRPREFVALDLEFHPRRGHLFSSQHQAQLPGARQVGGAQQVCTQHARQQTEFHGRFDARSGPKDRSFLGRPLALALPSRDRENV